MAVKLPSSQTFKSQEYIVESSEEEEGRGGKSSGKKTKASAPKSAVSSQDRNATATPKSAQLKRKAGEDVHRSSSKKQKPASPVSSASSSAEDSDDESSSSEEASPSPAQKAVKRNVVPSASPSKTQKSSQSRREPDTSSSDEEEDEDSDPESSTGRDKATNGGSIHKSASVIEDNTLPFVPPPGFTRVKSAPATNVAKDTFAKMSGKELWYITAPASVPLTQLKDLAMSKVLQGKTVMSHDGSQYMFAPGQPASKDSHVLLLPGDSGKYKLARQQFDQVFHLQRVMDLPQLSQSSADNSTPRQPRQQPEGLRMRWFPPGFNSSQPTSTSSFRSPSPLVATPSVPRSALKNADSARKRASVSFSSPPQTARSDATSSESEEDVEMNAGDESSEEDSSSSDEDSPQKPAAKQLPKTNGIAKKQPKAPIVAETSSSSDDSSSEEETITPPAAKPKTTPNGKAAGLTKKPAASDDEEEDAASSSEEASTTSSESSDESDSSSESDRDAQKPQPKKKTPASTPQPNGVKPSSAAAKGKLDMKRTSAPTTPLSASRNKTKG